VKINTVTNLSQLPQKKVFRFGSYSSESLDSPIELHDIVHERVLLKKNRMSDSYYKGYVEHAVQYFEEVQWAMTNSVDGLWVYQERVLDPGSFEYHVRVALFAYLEPKHATFWRLKYSGKV
jgi:hypothetical protein